MLGNGADEAGRLRPPRAVQRLSNGCLRGGGSCGSAKLVTAAGVC